MTRTELIAALAAIKQTLAPRVHVWRIVIDKDGNGIQRIHRGYFIDTRPRTSESTSNREDEP